MAEAVLDIKHKAEGFLEEERNSLPLIDKEAAMNRFLDSINDIKKDFVNSSESVREGEKLYSSITWLEDISENDEEIIEDLIIDALDLHHSMLILYVRAKRLFIKYQFSLKELHLFKSAIDDFEESLHEVREIIFETRHDKELNKLFDELA